MSTTLELAQLDAMLDATLDALDQRSAASLSADDVSYEADDHSEATLPEVEALWRMVALSREHSNDDDEAEFTFAMDDEDVGQLARIRKNAVERIEGLLSLIVDDCMIETGRGPERIYTRVGWRGDTHSQLAPGLTTERLSAHIAATTRALEARAQNLHGLAMVLNAASRIGVLIAAPGGTVMALPIAYECVRALHLRWNEHGSNNDRKTRRTPW